MCSVCGCRDKVKAKPPVAVKESKDTYICLDCGYCQAEPGKHCGRPMLKRPSAK